MFEFSRERKSTARSCYRNPVMRNASRTWVPRHMTRDRPSGETANRTSARSEKFVTRSGSPPSTRRRHTLNRSVVVYRTARPSGVQSVEPPSEVVARFGKTFTGVPVSVVSIPQRHSRPNVFSIHPASWRPSGETAARSNSGATRAGLPPSNREPIGCGCALHGRSEVQAPAVPGEHEERRIGDDRQDPGTGAVRVGAPNPHLLAPRGCERQRPPVWRQGWPCARALRDRSRWSLPSVAMLQICRWVPEILGYQDALAVRGPCQTPCAVRPRSEANLRSSPP